MKRVRRYLIGCRLCGETETLDSVELACSWYLYHGVKKHWEMLEKLHSATPEELDAAIAVAFSRGWLSN